LGQLSSVLYSRGIFSKETREAMEENIIDRMNTKQMFDNEKCV